VLTRVFRTRLNTRWGGALYTVLITPVVLLIVTFVVGQALGPNLGDAATLVGLTVLVPLTVGIAFDYFWMPAPDEVEVPETL
jgi:predicted Na+-dependent transporter